MKKIITNDPHVYRKGANMLAYRLHTDNISIT